MTEHEITPMSVETIHVDDEHSHVYIALRGLNNRTINHRSTTLYHVLRGKGTMEVDNEIHQLERGAIIEVAKGTPYQDEGTVDMEAISVPPFDITDIEIATKP